MIQSPGKFQGEEDYVPSLWGESSDNPVRVEVTPADVALFPTLAGRAAVFLWEDAQGFVHEIDEARYSLLYSLEQPE